VASRRRWGTAREGRAGVGRSGSCSTRWTCWWSISSCCPATIRSIGIGAMAARRKLCGEKPNRHEEIAKGAPVCQTSYQGANWGEKMPARAMDCELKLDGVWKTIDIDQALKLAASREFRCVECK